MIASKIIRNYLAVLKKLTTVYYVFHAKYAKESQKTQRNDSAHFALIIFVAFARTLSCKLLIKWQVTLLNNYNNSI